jgi:hypothetical protein
MGHHTRALAAYKISTHAYHVETAVKREPD